MMTLEKRYCRGGYDAYGRCYYSAWDSWARWVVFGLIILGALFIFFLFSCISARRRRKMGYSPYRGTGWAAGRTPTGHAPATYNSSQPQPYYANQQSYGQQQYGGQNAPPTYGASQDYYSRQNDVELQSPPNTYNPYGGNTGTYAPPSGPPPAKDGIIR